MNRKKEIVRAVVSWILTLLLCATLVPAALVGIAGLTLRRTNMLRAAETTDYVRKLRENVAAQYADIALTTGIPEEMSERFLTEYVSDETLLFPLYHFNEEGQKPDLAAFTENVLSEMRAYAKEMEEAGELRFASEEEKAELDKSLASLAKIYTQDLESAIRQRWFFSKLEYPASLYDRYAVWVYAGTAGFAVLTLGLLILIDRKKTFRYLYAVFGSCGLLFTVVPAVLLWRNRLAALNLEALYLRDWIAEMARSLFRSGLWFGAAFAALAILFGILALVTAKKRAAEEPTPGPAGPEEQTEETK